MAYNEKNIESNSQEDFVKETRKEEMIEIIRNKKNELKLDNNIEDVEIKYYEDFKYEIKGEIINCSMLEIITIPKQKNERSNLEKIRTYEIYIKNNDKNVLILTVDENGNIKLVEGNIEKIDPKHKKKWIKELQKDKKKNEKLNLIEDEDEKIKKEEELNQSNIQEEKEPEQTKQKFEIDDKKKIKINIDERKITNKEYFKDLVKIDDKYINIYIVRRRKQS